MIGALVILAALVIIGLLLYITDVKYFRHHHSSEERGEQSVWEPKEDTNQGVQENEVCCGMHLVCEKTSLSVTDDKVIYYDDEELDRFAGRSPESYTFEEKEEFRDVLLTLLPQDVAGWSKSITLRGIILPEDVREELLMIVNDVRGGN